jgi:succinyl-diaminopimelate desuccinylase
MEELNEEKLLLHLMKFDTQNSDDARFECENFRILNFVKKLLSPTKARIRIQKYVVYKQLREKKVKFIRGNLIAVLEKKKNLPFVMMQGHIDTVPVGECKSAVKNGKVFGRGATDMKGALAGILLAFLDLAKMKDIKYNPILLLTSEEETNIAGMKDFLRKNKIEIDFAINCEASNLEIKNRFKGVIYDRIEVFGKSGHGSKPQEGINAIEKAFPILSNLVNLSYFVNKMKNEKFHSKDDRSSAYSTMNIGKIEGGDKVNKIPSFCQIEYEMRPVKDSKFYVGMIRKRILEKINKKTRFKQERILCYDPMVISTNDRFIEKLKRSIKRNERKIKFGVISGFTEATLLNNKNIKTIVFGPGEEKYSHSDNEQIAVKDIKDFKNILITFFKS